MDFDINYSTVYDGRRQAVVLNCGQPALLSAGGILKNFQSGLFQGVEIHGERLVVIPVDTLEVTKEIADSIRSGWKSVYELSGNEQFKGADFYGLPGMKRGDFTFSFWYSGADFPGFIHRGHDFYELHTQILGHGTMQKFAENDEGTMFESVEMMPGGTHKPLFAKNSASPVYPWHRYQSKVPALLLGIESPYPIPVQT